MAPLTFSTCKKFDILIDTKSDKAKSQCCEGKRTDMILASYIRSILFCCCKAARKIDKIWIHSTNGERAQQEVRFYKGKVSDICFQAFIEIKRRLSWQVRRSAWMGEPKAFNFKQESIIVPCLWRASRYYAKYWFLQFERLTKLRK